MPAVSAIDSESDSKENDACTIYCAEKEIFTKFPSDKNTPEDLKKAEELRAEIEAQNEKEITVSVDKYAGEQLLTSSTVTLGTDATFTSADSGDSGTSSWGAAPNFKGSDYSASSKKARETAVTGPAGYGGCGAWAWVGKSFTVLGSGSQSANIRMSGHIYGLTSAAAGGSSSSNVDLVLKDLTTGTSYSISIYSKSCGGLGWETVDQNYNKGLSITLQSGHDYIAYLKISGSSSTYGAGEAGSDFGPWDLDDDGECVTYSSIVINF